MSLWHVFGLNQSFFKQILLKETVPLSCTAQNDGFDLSPHISSGRKQRWLLGFNHFQSFNNGHDCTPVILKSSFRLLLQGYKLASPSSGSNRQLKSLKNIRASSDASEESTIQRRQWSRSLAITLLVLACMTQYFNKIGLVKKMITQKFHRAMRTPHAEYSFGSVKDWMTSASTLFYDAWQNYNRCITFTCQAYLCCTSVW